MKLEEVETGVVFRLVKISGEFPAAATTPSPAHFNPSTRDVEHAKASGKPVLLSVWDRDRTTFLQSCNIYGQTDCVAFKLDVEKIREIRDPQREHPLRVFRDPLDPPASQMPGALGHCGLEGIVRLAGESRAAYRNLRRQLLKMAVRMEG